MKLTREQGYIVASILIEEALNRAELEKPESNNETANEGIMSF